MEIFQLFSVHEQQFMCFSCWNVVLYFEKFSARRKLENKSRVHRQKVCLRQQCKQRFVS